MKTLIKWPGGKSSEINIIKNYIPKYDRYIEPFFGGGALFFYLQPRAAIINDISNDLIEYYKLIKEQDLELFEMLLCYNNSFNKLLYVADRNFDSILSIYNDLCGNKIDDIGLKEKVLEISNDFYEKAMDGFREKLFINKDEFLYYIVKMVSDKIFRTVKNDEKRLFSNEDLKNNLITGFMSGYYMYFRKIYNDLNLRRIESPSIQYRIANFYFIREYCYGSMFRYNKSGEFNIPYGGISYNTKNFKNKIDNMFNNDVAKIFENTDIYCCDFEKFIKKINVSNKDFMFLDPPYDTDFSDYEGKDFGQYDQERLASILKKTSANFILIIKNTDFINNLYKDYFKILTFDKQYTYNVRSRNERNVEHLIITNLPV